MIFRIKHFWPLAIVVTFVGVVASWSLEAWSNLPGNKFSVQMLIAIGVGGALAALMINGILHETFKRAIGKRYLASFQIYGQDVLDGMGWPAYIAAGLMAGMAEEPIFRGLLLPLIEDASGSAVVAILGAALIFAACHWFKARYWPFWFWAMWEGVLFGIITIYAGSIIPAMIAHFLHDVIAYRVFQTLVRDSPAVTAAVTTPATTTDTSPDTDAP